MENNLNINDSIGLTVKSRPKYLEPNDSTRHSRLERQVSTDTYFSSSGYNSNDLDASFGDEQLYRVLYNYEPYHDDELKLEKNSIIKILSKDVKISGDDGWWIGINLKDSKRGIFPSNYVEPYKPDNKKSSDQRELPPEILYKDLEILECIGAGGFGKVYRGYWNRSDRKELVAIKEARVDGDKEDLIKIKENVLNEAKLFWVLRHPNIIQLKGICFQEPHFCLIMENAKGGSLGRLLSMRKIGFPPNILIKWALQVSQGMYYLHEQALPNKIPIIHRDLKSSNILLSEDVNEFKLKDIVLKLTDFGLARELEKTTEMNQAGTYSHMPPEVIKSSLYSKASDVWSFGVLLWELLTGEVPYKGIDPLAIAYGVAVNKLTLPIPSSCPKIFSDLIHNCWHTDPYKRLTFEKIIELLTDISNSTFASTSNELFWTMQQDWKSEIREMFSQIKTRENDLRTREEELEKISLRQQAYENMLLQRERELEQRERDLAVRELTIALQQLNPQPPEPKKRRKKLLTNFLKSNNSNSNLTNVNSRSFDISSPSDFQHCLSVQPELLINNSLKSSPTEELLIPSLSGNSSPNLRLKILHQKKTLSPNRVDKFHSNGKSTSIDIESLSKIQKLELNETTNNNSNKISKILYEIGSILSFVGLGKDYKNQMLTRRSQEKKSEMLSPNRASPQSHSLTRFHKTYPYRFKSLTCQSSIEQSKEIARTVANTLVVQSAAAQASSLSSSSSNLLSPRMALCNNGAKLNNQEILKKYSKSVDCPHFSQQTISTTSPLVPRRSDYEPVARVTIQRQQRVEESPSRLRQYLSVDYSDNQLTRPLTLSLNKASNSYAQSTTSTNEDDFLNENDKNNNKEDKADKLVPNRNSLSLSVSSMTSTSQMSSSISPISSPRLTPKPNRLLKQITSQKTIDESFHLTPK
ncbi:unnamed protein product [Brachionus calyciflorus]|uniref:mitogen-activated protein kinase kinase kinase n=1 Tax=Brachionus calyciflorus TaxID=104777 RepID=A0A813W2W8_9BILA|nr:unnamed protein product [Brachionus calyciflorus]